MQFKPRLLSVRLKPTVAYAAFESLWDEVIRLSRSLFMYRYELFVPGEMRSANDVVVIATELATDKYALDAQGVFAILLHHRYVKREFKRSVRCTKASGYKISSVPNGRTISRC